MIFYKRQNTPIGNLEEEQHGTTEENNNRFI